MDDYFTAVNGKEISMCTISGAAVYRNDALRKTFVFISNKM